MRWVLVVSEDERFQREAIRFQSPGWSTVGATGHRSACSLVRAIDVIAIVVDGRDDAARRFLRVLGSVPAHTMPPVVVVGPPDSSPIFATAGDLASGLAFALFPGTRAA